MTEFGAVLGTKDKKYKENFQNLQENIIQYVVESYKKGVDLALLIRKIKGLNLTNKESGPPTGPGRQVLCT